MIFVDVSAAVHSRAGLGRYSERLAGALLAQNPDTYGLFYNQGPDGEFPAGLPNNAPQRRVGLGYKPWRTAVLAGQKLNSSCQQLLPEATLFHATEHLLIPLPGIPTVLTVHDLIFKKYPAYHKRLNLWYLNQAMPLFCRRATALIAVSEATKRDVIAEYDIAAEKIHVVHEAAAAHFQPQEAARIAAVRAAYDLPQRFLIHLSTIEPRKNLDRLVDAVLRVRTQFPDLQLLLAGSKGWMFEDFFARIEREDLQGVIRPLGWVPDADLPAVLAAADLAVQPSLYEGFGLPILEHMASGQVVAASNCSSFPEVGGEAAAYFDPHDVDEMAAVITRLLSNKSEYAQRRELGLAQAQRFSWERAARETRAVYDELLEKQA